MRQELFNFRREFQSVPLRDPRGRSAERLDAARSKNWYRSGRGDWGLEVEQGEVIGVRGESCARRRVTFEVPVFPIVGKKLASGKTAKEILASQKAVAEGYYTAAAVHSLAARL